MENIDVLRLIQVIVPNSPMFEVLNEETQKLILEYIDVQIAIEKDINEGLG